jgi:hypothetical protein
MAEAWVQGEESVSYIRGAGEEPGAIVEQTPIMFSTLRPLAEQIFSSFLDAI